MGRAGEGIPRKGRMKETVKSMPRIPDAEVETSLEFDYRLKNNIMTGCKTTTIRKGHRHFAKRITIASHPAIVNRYQHYILSTVPLEILVHEGFKSIFDVITKLQKYYPDIKLSSPVTIVEFRMDVIDGGSTNK